MNRNKYRNSLLLISALAAIASRAHSEENAGPRNPSDEETRSKAMSVLLDTRRPSHERVEASRTLSTASSAELLPKLEPLLSDRDAAVRQAVVYTYALCALSDSKRFPSPLLRSLDDKAPQVRESVAVVVSLFESFTPADRDALVNHLADDAWQVRSKLASTMYLVDDMTRKSLPSLKKLLKDKHHNVAHNAANSIWHITHDAQLVVPPLIRLMVEFMPKSKDDMTLTWIASVQLLRNIGLKKPDACLSALVGMLDDAAPDLKVQVVRSIGAVSAETKDSRQAAEKMKIEALLDKLSEVDDEQVGQAALVALERIRGNADEGPKP